MKKIIFCDIDGTLVKSNGQVSNRTINTIGNLKQRDVLFVITSGRNRQFAINLSKKVNGSKYVISSNGAEVFDYENDQVIYSDNIDWIYVKKAFAIAKANNAKVFIKCGAHCYKNGDFFDETPSEIINYKKLCEIAKQENIQQFNIMDSKPETILNIMHKLSKYKQITISNCSKSLIEENYKTNPEEEYFLDINNANTSKGFAIKKLIEFLNVDPSDIISIGDSKNDISMFEITGTDVAMQNAINDLSKLADHITLSNNDDGVAVFIEEYFNL